MLIGRQGLRVQLEAKVITKDGKEIELGKIADSAWEEHPENDSYIEEAKEAKRRIKRANSRLKPRWRRKL